MKNIILIVLIVSISLVQKSFAQDTTANQSFQKIITSYLDVKNALVADNGDSVRVAAKGLYKNINDMQGEKLPPEQRKTWTLYSEKLSYDAEHMKQTDDIEHQREHFSKLSVNFYKMLKALNINLSDLYYQFCPMANNGKGAYWISESEQIRNPYFGKRMMTCGSTKETIAPKK